ncbi:MAG: hypothetical protein ACRDUV_00005 [Pseudonocardiaceae bacterium]
MGAGDGGASARLVDVLAMDSGGNTTLDRWEPSPDGRLLAVQTSQHGTEHGSLIVIDAHDGELIDGPIGGLRYSSVAWIDETAFYYVRGANVWLHRVGVPPAADRLVLAAPTTGPVLPNVRRPEVHIRDSGGATAGDAHRAASTRHWEMGNSRSELRSAVRMAGGGDRYPDGGSDGGFAHER